jgi:hypothetical protein
VTVDQRRAASLAVRAERRTGETRDARERNALTGSDDAEVGERRRRLRLVPFCP